MIFFMLLNSLSGLLHAHVLAPDARHPDGLFHGVAAERLAKLLIKYDLDEGRNAFLLRLAGLAQRLGQFGGRSGRDALKSAALGDFGIAEMRVELGADEVVIKPENRI